MDEDRLVNAVTVKGALLEVRPALIEGALVSMFLYFLPQSTTLTKNKLEYFFLFSRKIRYSALTVDPTHKNRGGRKPTHLTFANLCISELTSVLIPLVP